MVTNLPEAAKSQWKRVVEAKTPEQKLEELKKFLSMVPRHKGTKNLIKQCKRQMAKLREEIEEKRKRKTGVYISNWLKSKHGEGRIAVVGLDQPTIITVYSYLSHKPMQNSPYWLYEPQYSIYETNNIQFQLVALPPLGIKDSLDYKIYNYLKTCDYVIGTIDQSQSPQNFIEFLKTKGINLSTKKTSVEIIKMPSGGIRVVGLFKGSHRALEMLLREYRIYNAIIKIEDEADIDDIENAILDVTLEIPGIIIQRSRDYIYYKVEDENISNPIKLDKYKLLEEILSSLNLIRIYTSPNGKQVSNKPILLKNNSTVYDLAGILHRELQEKFKHAYVIRDGVKIKVSKRFALKDGDIVHIYV